MTVAVYVNDPVTDIQLQVPYEVIYECEEYTGLDAHSLDGTIEEIFMTDCYWNKMGFYDPMFIFPVDHPDLWLEQKWYVDVVEQW